MARARAGRRIQDGENETMRVHDLAQQGNAFTDPTMPGLSVRDLARRALDLGYALFDGGREGRVHQDFLVGHDMAHLDREILRDIGLDRSAQ